jgi:hypothetical protein
MSNKYELRENGIYDLETDALIPCVASNRHYNAYQQWLSEGNIPRPIKPNSYCSWDGSQWVEDTTTKQADEDAAMIRQLDQEMIAGADTLLECLLNNGTLTGNEPEIAGLMSKKAQKDALKAK